jgi:hypothetical protein
MARKPAEDHPPLPTEDYAFPAIPRAMADRFGNDQFHQMLDQFAEQSALEQHLWYLGRFSRACGRAQHQTFVRVQCFDQ